MRFSIVQAIAAVALSLVVTSAEAREPGFYVGGSVVYTELDVSKSSGILVSIGDGPFGPVGAAMVYPDSVEVDDGETGYGATVGYRFNRWLAAEVTYTQFGDAEVVEVYEFPPQSFFPPEIRREHKLDVSGPSLSVLALLPLGPVDLFARAGLLFANYTVDDGPRSSPQEFTFGDEVMLGGVGVDWSFATRWSARLEYQRTEALKETLLTGEIELRQTTASILFRF